MHIYSTSVMILTFLLCGIHYLFQIMLCFYEQEARVRVVVEAKVRVELCWVSQLNNMSISVELG